MGSSVSSDNMASESISVIVPVFNSEPMLPELAARLQAVLVSLDRPFEIIFVNDGSKDKSWEVIEELAEKWPTVRGIDLMRNFGQHNALLCGIRSARHSLIVTMDDDLQHPPEEISKLLDKLAQDFDVVYGSPEKEQHGLWRDMASRMTKFALQKAMGAKGALDISAFRVFRTKLREAFEDYRGVYVSLDVLLSWATTRFGAVKVAHCPRRTGISTYTLPKLIVHAVNLIAGFTTLPLRVASMLGFAFTLVGICVLVYVVGRFLVEASVPGFPFLASIIAIFAGVQLFALGIIGEYLSRMYNRVLDQPSYVVRRQIAREEPGRDKDLSNCVRAETRK